MTKEIQFNLDLDALKSVAPAMSTEETSYYLCGVHIFERDGDIYYEATNGHIAIRVVSDIEQEEDATGLNIIIPSFIVKNLIKKKFVESFGLASVLFLTIASQPQFI